MQHRPIGRVENYTNTCLVFFLVNLLCVFMVLWVVYGLPAVMLAGLVLNHLITRLERRRA